MKLFDWAVHRSGMSRVLFSSALLALGLVLVVWAGNRATRRELLTLLRDQAASLRQTLAAAARSNYEASKQAAGELEVRMLESAHMLAELDRHDLLNENMLNEMARRNRLFRVTIYGPNREEVYASGGARGPRRGFGPGFATGYGGSLLDRLYSDETAQEVTDIHVSRWGDWRGFAAVRREAGGAIVLNVDASQVQRLERQSSLNYLLEDITENASEVVYVVFEQDGLHIAHGEIPSDLDIESAQDAATSAGGDSPPQERETEVDGHSVLEFAGPIVLDEETTAFLRLGMRLDGLRRAEQRMLWQLSLSLAASLALAFLGIGTVWLQRKYSLLSERHDRTREALRRKDRLAAMGELSSTVAHEIRNPLNAISMSATRLRREFLDAVPVSGDDKEEAEELLGVLEVESRRVNDRIQQFLDFARPPRLAPRPTDLGELTRSVEESARATGAAKGVGVTSDLSSAGRAKVDPEQLRQALENLVRNAVEATPEGGRVSIVTRRRGKFHEIEVTDTGKGIEAGDLPRLFDLYFTTKTEGTGVGLAVAQQVVTAHGGTIEVDSPPGRGTTMTIKLPRAENNYE
jgi:signal transduction histidine kinase